MYFLYTLLTQFISILLPVIAQFNPKMKRFVEGRKNVWHQLETIKKTDKTIWFHAASLGEYEQGLPVIKKIKENYPTHKIVLTFFSPSGYEVRKNTPFADVICYLPLDIPTNVNRFLTMVNPEMVFFIKYEYWPNYLKALKKRAIPTYLVSGIFSEKQVFFKWYGGFYRNCLTAITHFFVQDEASKKLLNQLHINRVTVSGDTRFDRVSEILLTDNTLDFIARFTQNKTTVVIGSSWAKDEELLLEYINKSTHDVKWIIAPHNIKSDQIERLQKSCNKKVVLFSEKENKNLADYDVFILNTVGILTKVYSYASIAYVGGGFSSGIHNVLEPATFGVPIIIGSNFQKFNEAKQLVEIGACVSVSDFETLKISLDNLITNTAERIEKGKLAARFVQDNAGATAKIMNAL